MPPQWLGENFFAEELLGIGKLIDERSIKIYGRKTFFIQQSYTPPTPRSEAAFVFDLQRFDDPPASEPAQANNELSDTQVTEGDNKSVFSCVIGGETKYGAVSDFTSENLANATAIKLLGSFTMPAGTNENNHGTITIPADKSVTLDLNGQTLTKEDFGSAFVIADGDHTFEITDSATGGKILHTLDIVGTETDNENIVKAQKKVRYNDAAASENSSGYKYNTPVICVGSATSGANSTGNAKGATFNMTGGTILSNTSCVSGGNKSNISISGKSKLQSYMSSVVYLGNNGLGGHILSVMGDAQLISGANFEGTELKDTDIPSAFDSTKVTSTKNSNLPAIQVAGNFVQKEGTEQLSVTISGNAVVEFRNNETNLLKKNNGDYAGSPSAVYVGGTTKLTIEGNAKITSGGTGVEMRSGDLEVTGGTITSTATSYTTHSADSGTATFGAAIGIAQHGTNNKTNRPVTVNISGNNTNVSGPNALAVSNPQGNTDKDNNKITATIDGGNLKSTKAVVTGDTKKSGNAVLADNCNVFITVNDGNLNGNVSVSKIADADENTQKATVIVAGGTTTGTVKVVEVGNEGESTPTDATTNLKVMGGKISDTTSAKEYKVAGVEISSDGTVTESTKNGWSLTSDANGKYIHHYMLAGDTATSLLAVTLGTATDSVYLKYDGTNKLFGIPYSADKKNYAWDGGEEGDAKKGRYLAQQTVVGSAASIRPMTTGVKITGTGFIGSDIVSLTTASGTGTLESLGVVVDATDNRLAYIIGGKGKDSIKAGDRRTTLDGGANDDTLDGGDGIDTFYYSAGNDEIRNYEHGTDAVSITGDFTPPIDFTKATFGGSNFIFTFGDDDKNKLTFRNTSKVSLVKGDKVYTYEGNTGGNLNYMAIEGEGISLGTGYSGRFNGAATANADYKTINGARVNSAIRITGNDNPNFIVASSVGGGTLEGGEGNDTLMAIAGGASTASLRFEGGAGDDSLVGGEGYNLFVYTEGDDKIKGYHGKDLVTVRGNAANLETADFAFTENDIKLGFGTGDSLTFEGGATVENGVSVQSGKNLYVYKKDRIARNDEVITLTSGFADSIFSAGTYNTINAVNVTRANGVSISGNDNNNVIFGSKQGGTLFGGAGNDKLDVTERDSGKTFVFKYTEGKDTVSGFVAGNDKLDITAKRLGEISKAKSSKGDTRLAFTFNTSKSDVLTFNSDGDEIGRVSLSDDNGFLTKDGVVSLGSGGNRLDLFSSAKGKIDLTDTLYSVSGGIASVSAADVAKQSVTLIGASVESGSSYTFAGNNKKKDQFEYNGGNVTISGYEAGKDRLNLNTAALTGFTVGTDNTNVSLSGLGTGEVVVLNDMKEKEVLLHHAESKRNSFTKMVFKKDGVILNKEKRPTAATVYSGTYNASDDNSVKKIFVADGASSIAITAGGKNKTTLDASASNGNISLTGGAKNDKLIGSTAAADTFVYTAGKDIIQNYSSNDQISLGSFKDNLLNSKISAGSRSIKFKFSNKNSLTIKPAKGSTLGSALDISDTPKYTYAKNAVISGSNASLTSEFSGSYRLKNSGVNNVDGSLVKKNLTFKGTSDAETLAGGTKKTNFKGGGGNDNLIGGSGNDVFFYAKGDSGNTTIADFDFTKDKLKIAGGTITKITVDSGAIEFDMNNGRKNSANIGSFKINSSATYTGVNKTQGNFDPNSTLIKANNTYYWFAEAAGTDASGESYAQGALITTVSKVSKSQVSDYAVIDLGYSSNLINAGVATKVSGTFEKLKPSNSGGGTN